jgi:four helix bundle protein
VAIKYTTICFAMRHSVDSFDPLNLKTMNTELNLIYFDFQKLEVYRKSRDFYLNCKRVLEESDVERHVRDQLGRAAYSIALNIAEGSAKKTNADRRHFFTVARGSTFECAAILDILLQEGKIEKVIYSTLLNLASEISKMLFVMARNLES